MPTSTLLLYDHLLVHGGAEQVTLTLAKGLNCALRVGFYTHDFAGDLAPFENSCILTQPIYHPALRTLITDWAFRHDRQAVAHYDNVIYSGIHAPSAVFHQQRGQRIYYCHTPPRFAYDLQNWYEENLPAWQRPALRLLACWIRHHYAPAIAKMNVIVANSVTVKQRITQYFGLDSIVIHPPCHIENFHWRGQSDYYLSTARLEPYKRVDVLIGAFRQLPNKRLLIASGGSDEMRLRQLASGASNIVFLGWLNEMRLQELIGEAIATLYLAKDEDFGMSPVESMAAGKPVIGVNAGGLRETIIHGATGLLLADPPTAESVRAAVLELSPKRAAGMRAACEERAQAFGVPQFLSAMQALLAK